MSLQFEENIPLKQYTTLKTGGKARFLVKVKSVEEIKTAVLFAQQKGLPFIVFGGGSNLLVKEAGFSGLVIVMAIRGINYSELTDGRVELVVGAGEVLDELIAETIKKGYGGLENLSAIPGTVGATPVQNVGAYGVEVKDLISSVEVYDTETGESRKLSNADCKFKYRDSLFKTKVGKKFIITKVHFILEKNSLPNISYRDLAQYFGETKPNRQKVREAVCKIRSLKFPDWRVVGTAGSFFKNPIVSKSEGERLRALYRELPIYEVGIDSVKLSLGYILDKVCNLKGFRQGKVSLFENQALVLVQDGGATATDILQFVDEIKSVVAKATQVEIELEVQVVQ